MGEGVIIAGGAGFIGSHLARQLVAKGNDVLVLDNLSTGRWEYLDDLMTSPHFFKRQVDVSDVEATLCAMRAFHAERPVSLVWHLAANADIPAGTADYHVDLKSTFLTTCSLLEAMRTAGISRMAFASSSAIYGEHGGQPLREDSGPLMPISNYGAMKLASEAVISAAAESFLEKMWVFRFPNVVGVPATHGALLDFVRRLKLSPEALHVLGNGTQQKVYVHVSELVAAMLFIVNTASQKRNCFNIGPKDGGVTVRAMAEAVVARVAPDASIQFGVEDRGWVGDVPRFAFDVSRLESLGCRIAMDSAAAVRRAVEEIACQERC